MLPVRRSTSTEPNPAFVEVPPARGSNLAWLQESAAAGDSLGRSGDVLLLGGSGLADFRIRVAQSQLRHDMTPSYWSQVAVIDEDHVYTAPLWPLDPPDIVPSRNGIRRLPIADFVGARAWPNIAVVRFPGAQEDVVECIRRLETQRSIVDLPAVVLAWLGYCWGTGTVGNPLFAGIGLPGAVLVETAFGIAEVELTPGLAAASSCPEAIYQSAKWWHEFYEQAAGEANAEAPANAQATDNRPVGRYTLRSRIAAYREPTG